MTQRLSVSFIFMDSFELLKFEYNFLNIRYLFENVQI
jgi:hypothetical protein